MNIKEQPMGGTSAPRGGNISLSASLVLKLIPLFAPNFRGRGGLLQAIKKDRIRGPALPSARVRRVFNVSEESREGMRILRIAAPRGAPTPLKFLYLHGGAYVFQIQAMQWGLAIALLKRLGGEVITPFYPLAPEQDWRAGQKAVRQFYLQLAAEHGANNIVIMGDSAGGGLALALAQSLRGGGSPLPLALLLFSPWLDLAVKGEDQPVIQLKDPALTIEFLREAGKLWAGDLCTDDPRVSPLFGESNGLPPTLVFSGTRDILDSDALRLAARDPAIVLQRYPEMFHVWPAAGIPEGRRALDAAAEFIRQTAKALL